MASTLITGGSGRVVVDNMRTSLWFLPSIMTACAALLFTVAHWGAADYRDVALAPWWLYVGSPEEARSVLATLLTSMITMTSLVFSITVVVLTLAARQFGPRLVRNFMGSLHTQFVLGMFMMTMVFVLLSLPTAGARDDSPMSAFPVVTIALGLTSSSVVLLIPFIHSLARSIVSETIIEQVGAELDALLRRLPPARIRSNPEDWLPSDFDESAASVGPGRSGYVQAVRFERLVEIAAKHDLVIGLYFKPGDYLVVGGAGVALYPASRADEGIAAAVQGTLVIGGRRTPAQDPEYAIRHLVEIAVRSLSPSMNDPYTAIAVINRLSSSLCRLMHHSPPPSVFCDGRGVARLICPQPTYASLLKAAFDQIRQLGTDKPIVTIYLLEALRRIAEQATLPEQISALSAHVDLVSSAIQSDIKQTADREAVETRIQHSRDALRRSGDAAVGRDLERYFDNNRKYQQN